MINICNSSQGNNIHDISNQSINRSDFFDCSNIEKESVKRSTKFMLKAYSDGNISANTLNNYVIFFLQSFLENRIEKRLSHRIDMFERKMLKKIYERE